MNKSSIPFETTIYEQCGLKISDIEIEVESKEYAACSFQLNGLHVIRRTIIRFSNYLELNN